MKKLKKVLAVLSSVMMLSTCAVSYVYAENSENENATISTDENYDEAKVNETYQILLKALEDNDIFTGNLTIMNHKVVYIVYDYWTHENTEEQVRKIVEENNIGDDVFNFIWAASYDPSEQYDFSFESGNRNYNCKLDDKYVSYDAHDYYNGIVFETDGKTDISKLGLKYEFTQSNYFTPENVPKVKSMVIGHNKSHSGNVYSYCANGNAEELTEYANEIAKMDGIKYAEVFKVDVHSNGTFSQSNKDNCCLFIKSGANTDEYMKKLNDNKELTEYLASIDANTEVKTAQRGQFADIPEAAYLYISGIKDRTKLNDIYEKLRSFEDIGDNAVLLTCSSITSTPSAAIDFIGRDYTGDANEDKYMDVRDCAEIASKLAQKKGDTLPETADYNKDGKKDVRDAAAMARALASGIL